MERWEAGFSMPVVIRKGSSRLVHSDLLVVDGIEFWTRPDLPTIEPDISDEYHVIDESDRSDIISRKKYKRDDWWWVLAHRNNYRLLPDDLVTGHTAVVPRASLVRKSLF